MSQEQYSTRLPADDAEKLEEHCKEANISKAEALRRSVREYIEESGESEENRPIWFIVIAVGIVALLVNQFSVPLLVTGASVSVYFALLLYAIFR